MLVSSHKRNCYGSSLAGFGIAALQTHSINKMHIDSLLTHVPSFKHTFSFLKHVINSGLILAAW